MTFLAPTGPITAGVFGLQRLVSESTAFQRRVGADDALAAEAFVHRWALHGGPQVVKTARPCALVWCADPTWDKHAAGQGANTFIRATVHALLLTDIDRNPANRSLSGDNFAKWIDEVLQQIIERSNVDDRLDIKRISIYDPRRAESPVIHSNDYDNRPNDRYWDAWFRVET